MNIKFIELISTVNHIIEKHNLIIFISRGNAIFVRHCTYNNIFYVI